MRGLKEHLWRKAKSDKLTLRQEIHTPRKGGETDAGTALATWAGIAPGTA